MKRNKFGLSHYKLLTCNFGELIPLTWFSVLPSDSIQHRTNMLVRLSPLLSPIMHPVVIRIHHWFVPLRLVWENFEDFITGGEDGLDTTVHPFVTQATVNEGTIFDYLGVPDAAYSPSITCSALPFRAYNLIFNEHYRDQQLVSEVAIDTGDGSDTTTTKTIQKVAWSKDYFTAARPDQQLGTDINIPLSGSAPITGIGKETQVFGNTSKSVYETDGTNPTYAISEDMNSGTPTADQKWQIKGDASTGGYPEIYADLSAATGVSANELRLYMALQRYKENRNEFGSRYVEYIRQAFGTVSSDARLQNPEFLGGGRQTIAFSEILSTADSGTDVVGTMRGHGIAAMRSNRYRRFFQEHGIVMSLLSVIPKAIYANGLHREFNKTTKEDYYQKELASTGDQAILNKEVYSEHSSRDDTFGYNNIYDEYRSLPSGIAGEFRSSLNHWHYARMFSGDQSLNNTFIECNPTKRQYADNASDVLYVMANHSIQARRPLPRYPSKRLM